MIQLDAVKFRTGEFRDIGGENCVKAAIRIKEDTYSPVEA